MFVWKLMNRFGIFLPGTFLIKPNKKSEAEKKFAKHLGMIAGGTGKTKLILWSV